MSEKSSIKYLILGRSGTGKDTLRSCLESYLGWKFVKSYTTRKPRYAGENTHAFVSETEAKSISGKVAQTKIKNSSKQDWYFATEQQVRDCDAYIVDPFGLYQILTNMPFGKFSVIYIDAYSNSVKRAALRNRGDSFLSCLVRRSSEDARFDAFEQMLDQLKSGSIRFNNLQGVCCLHNKYTASSLEHMADCVEKFTSIVEAVKYIDPEDPFGHIYIDEYDVDFSKYKNIDKQAQRIIDDHYF